MWFDHSREVTDDDGDGHLSDTISFSDDSRIVEMI
jgi:hypothetical protein